MESNISRQRTDYHRHRHEIRPAPCHPRCCCCCCLFPLGAHVANPVEASKTTAPKLPTDCQTFRLGVACPYAYLPGTHYAGEETALYSGVRRGPHSHTIEGPPHPLLPFSRPLFALKSARPPASARVSDSLAQGNGPGSPTSLPCAARYLWRLLLLPGAWLASLDVDTKGIRSCFGTSAPPHSDSLKPLILNTHTHTHLLPPLPPTLRRQPYSSLSLSLKT